MDKLGIWLDLPHAPAPPEARNVDPLYNQPKFTQPRCACNCAQGDLSASGNCAVACSHCRSGAAAWARITMYSEYPSETNTTRQLPQYPSAVPEAGCVTRAGTVSCRSTRVQQTHSFYTMLSLLSRGRPATARTQCRASLGHASGAGPSGRPSGGSPRGPGGFAGSHSQSLSSSSLQSPKRRRAWKMQHSAGAASRHSRAHGQHAHNAAPIAERKWGPTAELHRRTVGVAATASGV